MLPLNPTVPPVRVSLIHVLDWIHDASFGLAFPINAGCLIQVPLTLDFRTFSSRFSPSYLKPLKSELHMVP